MELCLLVMNIISFPLFKISIMIRVCNTIKYILIFEMRYVEIIYKAPKYLGLLCFV